VLVLTAGLLSVLAGALHAALLLLLAGSLAAARAVRAHAARRDEAEAAPHAVQADLEHRVETRTRELAICAQRWQETFDAIEDPVLLVSRRHRILRANRAAQALGGGEDVVGRPCHEVVHGTAAPLAGCPARQVWRTGAAARAELQEPHLGGRWFDAYTYPVKDEQGRAVQVVHTLRDITDRKRAETLLTQHAAETERLNAELERSNRELQQFTYAVSHDLQEPLRKVHSFAEFLVEDCGPQLSDAGRGHLGRMRDAALRMQALIRRLLELSRIETRGAEPLATDPNEVVARALDTLSERVRECRADIRVQPGLPTVAADPVQLEQVFQNLLGNALKFRAPDRAPKVRITGSQEDGRVTFRVSDNGIGIEPAYLDRIFVVFQKLHARDRYEGTGVGLALCEKIVRRHGGRIWVESEPGRGSTFRFVLPAAPGKKEETDGRDRETEAGIGAARRG